MVDRTSFQFILISTCCARFSTTNSFFFFIDTATTEIYTLSLHDALPIFRPARFALAAFHDDHRFASGFGLQLAQRASEDRKSTRLNSSHGYISYAVFCLKKKKRNPYNQIPAHTRSSVTPNDSLTLPSSHQ